MAARGGADEAGGSHGGSQDSDEGEGDPGFNLLPAAAKRKELKRRQKEVSAQNKGPSTRPGAVTRGNSEQPDAVVRGRAAPPAAAAAAAEEEDDCLEDAPPPKTPTIAERNRDAPRNRSLSSEKRLREAVQEAAELEAARRKRRQPQLGAVPETADEQEGEAEAEEEDGDDDDDDDDEAEPEAFDPTATGRPVRAEADRGKVSYKNTSAPQCCRRTSSPTPLTS